MENGPFKDLIGKRVSILITGKDNKKEAYTGILDVVEEKWIHIKFFEEMLILDGIWIRKDAVESIWIYRE